MIFRNKNIFKSKIVDVFDIKDLDSYLANEKHQFVWHGISIQIKEQTKIGVNQKAELYRKSFYDVIDSYPQIACWIIQPKQSVKLFAWFDKKGKIKLEKLKSLVGDNKEFKGYITVDSSEIKNIFRDLFIFSYATNSQDLMIFNQTSPFVMIMNQHLCLDIISTNKSIISEIGLNFKKQKFVIKKYS